MALTSNKSLTDLVDAVQDFKAEFEKTVLNIKESLNKINERLFQETVLSLSNDSWDNIRKKRNYLLSSTDWTMIPGATVDQAAWAAYRQVLRDLPQTYKDKKATQVVWPKQPSLVGPNTTQVK